MCILKTEEPNLEKKGKKNTKQSEGSMGGVCAQTNLYLLAI